MNRPLISFVLLAYCQENIIAEAVNGALSQTYRPLEIILSDDCSTDRTFQVIQESVSRNGGDHRVIVRQNPYNLGLIGHLNLLMGIAQGEWIIIAAGDDISLPERTEKIYQAIQAQHRPVFSIFSNAIIINQQGVETGLLRNAPPDEDKLTAQYLARNIYGVHGCSHAWNREVFDFFGPLDNSVPFEDIAITFRSAVLGNVVYLDEKLVKYRYRASRVVPMSNRVSLREYFSQASSLLPVHINIYRDRARVLAHCLDGKIGDPNELTLLQKIVVSNLEALEYLKSLGGKNVFKMLFNLLRIRRRTPSDPSLVKMFLSYRFPLLGYFRLQLYVLKNNLIGDNSN